MGTGIFLSLFDFALISRQITSWNEINTARCKAETPSIFEASEPATTHGVSSSSVKVWSEFHYQWKKKVSRWKVKRMTLCCCFNERGSNVVDFWICSRCCLCHDFALCICHSKDPFFLSWQTLLYLFLTLTSSSPRNDRESVKPVFLFFLFFNQTWQLF